MKKHILTSSPASVNSSWDHFFRLVQKEFFQSFYAVKYNYFFKMSAFLFPSLSDSLNLNYKKHEDHEWNIKDKLKSCDISKNFQYINDFFLFFYKVSLQLSQNTLLVLYKMYCEISYKFNVRCFFSTVLKTYEASEKRSLFFMLFTFKKRYPIFNHEN